MINLNSLSFESLVMPDDFSAALLLKQSIVEKRGALLYALLSFRFDRVADLKHELQDDTKQLERMILCRLKNQGVTILNQFPDLLNGLDFGEEFKSRSSEPIVVPGSVASELERDCRMMTQGATSSA